MARNIFFFCIGLDSQLNSLVHVGQKSRIVFILNFSLFNPSRHIFKRYWSLEMQTFTFQLTFVSLKISQKWRFSANFEQHFNHLQPFLAPSRPSVSNFSVILCRFHINFLANIFFQILIIVYITHCAMHCLVATWGFVGSSCTHTLRKKLFVFYRHTRDRLGQLPCLVPIRLLTWNNSITSRYSRRNKRTIC